MMKMIVATMLAIGPLAAPAVAQDWLGTHLQQQQEDNLRRHQQEMSTPASGSDGKTQDYNPPISGQTRHAAMRRHHREYAKIMRQHGYRVADQWLADQVAAGR